ncbi:hypothetical protein GCM10027347_47430 [Larkinella harenae]
MPYSEPLADRVRERLADLTNLEEIAMMGGRLFLYNDKMLVGVIQDELLCRVDPAIYEQVLEKNGCRVMYSGSRPMKGYVLVDDSGMRTQKEFDSWINLALDFNPRAKSSRKK